MPTDRAVSRMKRFILTQREKAQDKGFAHLPTFHGLRHTGAVRWIAQGMTLDMMAHLLGHSVKVLAKIYDRTGIDTLRKSLLSAKTEESKEAAL